MGEPEALALLREIRDELRGLRTDLATATARPQRPMLADADGVLDELLRAARLAFGNDAFTASEVLARAESNAELLAAVRHAVGDAKPGTAKALGHLFAKSNREAAKRGRQFLKIGGTNGRGLWKVDCSAQSINKSLSSAQGGATVKELDRPKRKRKELDHA